MHAVLLTLACCALGATPAAIETPRVVDPRLRIELFAAEPEVVTPTGIAVDEKGGVLVIESHTHFRPKDYAGPPADRIRLMEDTDGDGRADRISTFFEGTEWTMNLAVFRDGSIYVATRNEVFRLRDTDGDGRADERTPIVHLESAGNYPHNGLSGFAFDFADHVYFGMGENLGVEFKLVGSDGSNVSGREGGHIFRCDREGGHLVRWATGFWNPFHLAFDGYERLFAVDNDPDSLPPCRLLHIVEGGNYGYKYRNGRKGLHPFTAWNGELPGTLPMVAGTGEAPSGILAYESDNLPDDYRGDLLVTSWGDHRIERYHLEPQGASFRSQMQPMIVGGENFRPVGIAMAPDGSLYVSDWVDKSYPVHGKGRIWHISAAEAKQPLRPNEPKEAILSKHRPLRDWAARELASDKPGVDHLWTLATNSGDSRVRASAIVVLKLGKEGESWMSQLPDQTDAALRALAIQTRRGSWSREEELLKDPDSAVQAAVLRSLCIPSARSTGSYNPAWFTKADRHLESEDPFVWQAARWAKRGGAHIGDATPRARISMLLIARDKQGEIPHRLVRQSLRDPDPWVRFVAVQWIGENRLTDFRDEMLHVLLAGTLTERLFAAYLAALERLDGSERGPKDEWAGEQYVVQALLDKEKTPPEARRWALRSLRPDHPALSLKVLAGILSFESDLPLRLEAVRSLRESSHPDKRVLLLYYARDGQSPATLKLDAIAGLSPEWDDARTLLLNLAQGADTAARDEALRSLRGAALNDDEKKQLARVAQQHPEAAELVRRVLEPGVVPSDRPKPEDLIAWLSLLDGRADAAAGERIFYHAKSAGCSRCHQMSGRGGRIGPDLTTTARTLTRERLVESILRPSKGIAPMFVPWTIVATDGRTLGGLLVNQAINGELTYANERGELFRLKPDDIETRVASPKSIMPDGLPDLLTVQEFRDLLAFLSGGS